MKNKEIHFRVDEETHEIIRRKALEAYLNVSEYALQCCLGKQIFVIPGLEEMVMQQKYIGNNLNQLTRMANSGQITVIDLERFASEYAKISETLSDLMERRRWR